jgi:hypothetical protein
MDDKPINLSRIKMKSIIHEFLSFLSDDDLKELAQDIVRKQLERREIQTREEMKTRRVPRRPEQWEESKTNN